MKINRAHIVFMILVCVLAVCAAVWVGAGTTGIISGVVKDAENGKPLSGANVIITGTNLSTVTDSKGYYVITNVAPGDYEVSAEMVGYATNAAGGVQVTMDTTSTANVELKQAAIAEEVVVVTRPKPMVDAKQVNTLDLITPQQEILTRTDPSSVHSAPGVLSAFPGVIAEPDGSGMMHMRGGRYNEIGWYIEGISIIDPNIGSFGTNLFTTGASRFQAYTGGFGAEYGNATSGTLNEVIKTGTEAPGFKLDAESGDQAYRNALLEFGGGTAQTFNFYAGSALYTSDLDGPFVKDTNYADNVVKMVWPSKNDSVTVLAMQGSMLGHPDSFHDVGDNNVPTVHEQDWMRQRYNVNVATWSHNFSPKSFITVRPYYLFTTAVQNLMGAEGMYNNVKSARTGMQVNYTNQINEKQLLKLGSSITTSDNNYYLYAYMDGYGVYEPYHYKADVNTIQSDMFAEDNIKFSDRLTVQAGLRKEGIKYDRTGKEFDGTAYNGPNDVPDATESRITPRLGVSYAVDSRTVWKANWGQYTKFVPASSVQNIYFDPTVESSSSGIGATEPEQSTAMELSFEKQTSDTVSCRITPFYTKYQNMGDTFTFTDDNSGASISRYVNVGRGEATGIEMLVKKKMSDNWQGWLSYTFQSAKSNRADAGDLINFYNTSWDQRNTFAMVADYKNGRWAHNIRADFGSGRADSTRYAPLTSQLHARPFALLSYGMTLDLPKDSAVGNQVYLSIFNVFNNKQASQYGFDPYTGDRVRKSWMPGRFISLGVNKAY